MTPEIKAILASSLTRLQTVANNVRFKQRALKDVTNTMLELIERGEDIPEPVSDAFLDVSIELNTLAKRLHLCTVVGLEPFLSEKDLNEQRTKQSEARLPLMIQQVKFDLARGAFGEDRVTKLAIMRGLLEVGDLDPDAREWLTIQVDELSNRIVTNQDAKS